jgi:hypothetical protein
LPALDTLPLISDYPESTTSADSDEMEDLNPVGAIIVPQPMYMPTINNELDDLDTVPDLVQSPSIPQYNQKEEVLTYCAEAIPHIPPVTRSQPMFHRAGDIASAEVETKEEVPVITGDEPSSSEVADTTLECSDTVQNIGIKQVDLDPKYTTYRSTEEKRPQILRWDTEDDRDPCTGNDCSDEEMKETINRMVKWELRVPKCSNATLENEIRVSECPTVALDNESGVTKCPTTALDNESVQSQLCPQKPAPIPSIEETVLPASFNGNVPKKDGTIRDLCAVEPTSAADSVAENIRTEGSTASNLQVELKKQSFKIEQLEKELKDQKEKRVRIWRSTVHEAVAKKLKNEAQRVAELDHRETSLALERSQFDADCADREEELASREKKLAIKERDHALKLQALQTREAQLAEHSLQLELKEEEQKERDKAAASRLEKAQEELERLKKEKKQSLDDANLRLKKAQEELERIKKEKERAKVSSDSDQIPPAEVFKGSPDIPCNNSADLATVFSSGSSNTPSMFVNDRDIELEDTWSIFTDARVFEDPHKIQQNMMFLSTWDCDSDIEYNWLIFIDARVSEDPQQIEQNLMFSSTWDMEERVADSSRAPTRPHWKWMLPLLLVLALLSFTIPKLLQEPLSSRQEVIFQHLPHTCSFAERLVTIPSPISQADCLCLADYSNNYSEASSFAASGFIDLANDVRPLGEPIVDIGRVRGAETSPSTRTVFKIWFWNFVLTGTAHGRVGVEAGRRELYH